MSVASAAESVFKSFLAVFDWLTGGRTKDENLLRARAEAAQKEHDEAIDSGDAGRITDGRDAQLRVLDEARSKRP